MSITSVFSFIASEANEEDIDQITAALERRRRVLAQIKSETAKKTWKTIPITRVKF